MLVLRRSNFRIPYDVRFRIFVLLLNPSGGTFVIYGYLNAFNISLD